VITLYAFGPFWGLPDPSPFVLKTEVQLKMAGLAYQVEYGALQRSPKSKLPFIDDDGQVVSDSVFIRDHIEKKYGLDLDAGLTPAERAQAWMIERTCEDHLYWAIVHARWGDADNFAIGPADFFRGAPDEIRNGARERMIGVLQAQGFGRHGFDEVGELARRSFAALSAQLGDKPYLFGDTMTAADASAFATVAAALVPRFGSPMGAAAASFPNLVAYRDRLMARFYPDVTADQEMPKASSTRPIQAVTAG
jgi:glutathione S-transferase